MRGLWRCNKVVMDRLAKAIESPNSAYTAKGCPTQATQGCGKYNLYISRVKDVPGGYKRKVDTRCAHCNRRVKFQWSRQDDRGRPRPVTVLMRPDTMPRRALVQEMQGRNSATWKDEANTPINTGFSTAKQVQNETAMQTYERLKRDGPI